MRKFKLFGMLIVGMMVSGPLMAQLSTGTVGGVVYPTYGLGSAVAVTSVISSSSTASVEVWPGVAFPVSDNSGSLTVDQQPATQMVTGAVTLSSVTATEILAAETGRKSFSIRNTSGTDQVFISTYAATVSAGLWILGAVGTVSDIFTQDADCYTGALFGLGAAGSSTSTIRVVETQ